MRRIKERQRRASPIRIAINQLLFMDDMWAAADSRENLRVNLNTFVRIGAAFGFEIHAGTPGCGSKTKALMVMAASSRRVTDLRPLVLADGRTIPFVKSFKYLGSVFHDSMRDEEAITARLNKANALFAMNKKLLCSRATSSRVKRIYYESCVLSALQYGVEAWKRYPTRGGIGPRAFFIAYRGLCAVYCAYLRP